MPQHLLASTFRRHFWRADDVTEHGQFAAVYGSPVGTSRQLVRCSDLSEVGGRPELAGRCPKRRECAPER